MKIEDRGSRIDDRRLRHLFDPRSSILYPRPSIGCPSHFCARPGYASLPACNLGERLIDWKRGAPESYCLLRPIIAHKHTWPDPSALSPPNALLSETARWKRCVPSFIPTAPQKSDGRPPQSLILPKDEMSEEVRLTNMLRICVIAASVIITIAIVS